MTPSRDLALFNGGRVAALVKRVGMSSDAALKGSHDVAAPVGGAVTPGEGQLAVVGAVRVAHHDASRVKGSVTVEALITRQSAQHATRPVFARHV